MRKKILFSTAAVAVMAVASIAALTSNNYSRELSDLELANIEALTDDEAGGFSCRWKWVGVGQLGLDEFHCLRNGEGAECNCGDVHYGPQ